MTHNEGATELSDANGTSLARELFTSNFSTGSPNNLLGYDCRRASRFPKAPSLTSRSKSSSCLKSLMLRGMQRLLAIGARTPCSEKCRPRNGESSFKSTLTTTLNNLRPRVALHLSEATLEAK